MINYKRAFILEQLVYLVIWLIVFLVPVVMVFWPLQTALDSEDVNWSTVFRIWGFGIAPFFILFCINDLWLIPSFLLRKRYLKYILFSLFFLLLFGISEGTVNQFTPTKKGFPPQNHYENQEKRQPPHHDDRAWESPKQEAREHTIPPPPKPSAQGKPQEGKKHLKAPLFFAIIPLAPLFLSIIIAILMIGFNIAIKLLIKSLKDEERMKDLERSRLKSELEVLKYEISPHFFMNTLNNIHALVDIDTEQAQKAIVYLSKMMRYVLYETNRDCSLLRLEIQFMNNYIKLMRLRYTNQIIINVSFPEDPPNIDVPPLLYISFIENAFKHGVSYKNTSVICIALEVKDEALVFNCSNSNHGKSEEQHKGIGLENIQKRLKLIYDTRYTLSINSTDNQFNVLLITPTV